MNDKLKRILAAIIDFYIICFLSTAFIGILTLGRFNITPFSVTIYLVWVSILLVLKDLAFQNESIGKRIFKLKVIKTDGTKLTAVDIIKRNILILVLLPIEIFLLTVDGRRIGDV